MSEVANKEGPILFTNDFLFSYAFWTIIILSCLLCIICVAILIMCKLNHTARCSANDLKDACPNTKMIIYHHHEVNQDNDNDNDD